MGRSAKISINGTELPFIYDYVNNSKKYILRDVYTYPYMITLTPELGYTFNGWIDSNHVDFTQGVEDVELYPQDIFGGLPKGSTIYATMKGTGNYTNYMEISQNDIQNSVEGSSVIHITLSSSYPILSNATIAVQVSGTYMVWEYVNGEYQPTQTTKDFEMAAQSYTFVAGKKELTITLNIPYNNLTEVGYRISIDTSDTILWQGKNYYWFTNL